MTLAKQTVKCPYCKEPIVSGATRCRHCHADLGESDRGSTFRDRYDRFRTGFLFGVLFTIVLAIITYYHFVAGK